MVRIISALILAVTAVCASAAEPLQLVDNPPDRHVVVRGDTLWGISGKFLKEPWRWPEIWNMNRDQIKNPHLIYPGEVVFLDRSGSNPRLRILLVTPQLGALCLCCCARIVQCVLAAGLGGLGRLDFAGAVQQMAATQNQRHKAGTCPELEVFKGWDHCCPLALSMASAISYARPAK